MKKNKVLLLVAISMIAISPFLIFKFNFILGLLILITGIFTIIARKKDKKVFILVPTIVTIVVVTISILLNALINIISRIAIQEYFVNDMSILVSLLDEIMYYPDESIYLFEDPAGVAYMILAFNSITNRCCIILLLPLLLLIGNVIFKKGVGKIITSCLVAILSIYAISVIYDYFFLAGYADVFMLSEEEIPNTMQIIIYIFDGYNIEEILSYILTNSIIGSIKWLCLLPMIISCITLVLSITSVSCGCKKHKHYYEEKEQNEQTQELKEVEA